MATTGEVFPTSGANVDRAGNAAWGTPGNVTANDAANTSVVVPSDYLVASAFSFAIPADNVIVGITVRVEASETGTGGSNYIPQLISATTPTLIGAAKGAVTVNGTTPTVSSNGGIGDLWGAALTPTIVNAAGFGVALWSDDTTNTLSVDYLTIEVTYTNVQHATNSQRTFCKTRNHTHRRRRDVPATNYPALVSSASPDRAINAQFVTLEERSRRLISAAWVAGMAPTVAAPSAQPIGAWFSPRVVRKAQTKFTRRELPSPPLATIKPSPVLFVEKLKVFKIGRRMTLMRERPLALFPPPTGPPAVPNAALAPVRRNGRRKPRAAIFMSPAALVLAPYPLPQFPSWVPPRALIRRPTKHRRLKPQDTPYPAPAAPTSPDRALVASFQTSMERSRRLIRPAGIPAFPATPPIPPQPQSAWALKKAFTVKFVRKLRVSAPAPSTPATPATPAQPPAALVTRRVNRRRSRQAIFLAPDSAPIAVTPFTSWWPQRALRRKETRRRLRTLRAAASMPQTPAAPAQPPAALFAAKLLRRRNTTDHRLVRLADAPVFPPPVVPPQPITALKATASLRRKATRHIVRDLIDAPVFPPTPPVPPQAVTSRVAARSLRRRETERKLRRLADAPVYPQTPVPSQPIVAWILKLAARVIQRRRLQPAAPQPSFPPTPPVAAWTPAPKALRRRETERTLRVMSRASDYPPTVLTGDPVRNLKATVTDLMTLGATVTKIS